MTDRERLAELLNNHCAVGYEGNECTNRFTDDCGECLADYILADGWIRPPCKVGDTLYRIIKMSTGIDRKIINTKSGGIITPCEPTIKKFIRTVTVTKNNYLDCCEKFGITVFASREEAEKALRKDEGK